jgi:hypothetical protein
MVRLWMLWLVGLALLAVPPLFDAGKAPAPRLPEAERPPLSDRVQRLRAALDRKDDAALLGWFRQATLTTPERAQVRSLIARLGADSFPERERAADRLEAFRPAASGLLREAGHHPDAEIASRSRRLLDSWDDHFLGELVRRGLQQLASTQPVGSTAVLLAYLPDATEGGADEVRAALTLLSEHSGVPDPVLVRALADPVPAKRSAAGVALASFASRREAVRRLLDDPDPGVRHRVALALLPHRERAVLPALIGLLPELPEWEAWEALDLLYQAGGASAPAVPLGQGEERVRCRDAWRAWFRLHGAKLDLARVPFRRPGPVPRDAVVLLVEADLKTRSGRLAEVGQGGTRKELLSDLNDPLYADRVGQDLFLTVEHQPGLITQRNEVGSTRRELSVKGPLFAERLPGGGLFVVTRDALLETNRAGKTVREVSRPVREIAAARRLPDGRVLFVTDSGSCHWLDRDGLPDGGFETGCTQVVGAGIDVTPNGRLLLPDYRGNRVIEFNAGGEILWQAEVTRPTSAQRLANGHTLVASTTTHQVAELDRLGKPVWRYTSKWSIVAATRR